MFNKRKLGYNCLNLRKITKYYIINFEKSIKDIYKILTYLQIGILTIKSYITSFIFFFKFDIYCPIIIRNIDNKIIVVFKLNNSL